MDEAKKFLTFEYKQDGNLLDSSATIIDEVNPSNVLVVDLKESTLKDSNGSTNNKCDLCNKYFKNPTKLLAHKKCHSIRPASETGTTAQENGESGVPMPHIRISAGFRCHICSYEAKQRGTLNRHLRIHREEKQFSCEYCEYTTRHNSTLKTHIKSHLNNKEFECTICLKKFLTNQNLKVHKLVHTGERPHVCHLCNKAFVQRQHLNTHYTRVHRH